MPKRSSKKKTTEDTNEAAFRILGEVTAPDNQKPKSEEPKKASELVIFV